MKATKIIAGLYHYRGYEILLAEGCGHWNIRKLDEDIACDAGCSLAGSKRIIDFWIDGKWN